MVNTSLGLALAVALGATGATPAPHPSPLPRLAPGERERTWATASATAIPPAPYTEVPLPDALASLDRQNLTLAQVRSRTEQAAAVVRESASALLPTISASGSYVRNSDQARIGPMPVAIPGFPPAGIVMQPLDSLSATGTVRLPIVVPTAWFDLAAASNGARSAGESAAASRQQIRAGFIQSAHAALALEEAADASQRAIDNAAELARSAERRVAAGTAAPLDVLKAKTELVRRQSDLANTRALLDRSRLALGVLLGRADRVRIVVPEEQDGEPDGGELPADDALAAEAVARRPEVRAQVAAVQSAAAQVRSAWARLLPQVYASGSAFAADVPYVTGKDQGWRATIDLTWVLYDGGFRYGKRREAEAALAGVQAAAEAQKLAVVQEALDAARDLAVARERLRLARSQRALASDAAASAKRSFDAGIASSLDVIDANDRLFQADIGLADARARLASARVALARALGREI